MNDTTFWGELTYPFRTMGILLALFTFAVMLLAAGLAGEAVAVMLRADAAVLAMAAQVLLVLPVLLRFVIGYLEARMRGSEPKTLHTDHFGWFSEIWSLWPLAPLVGSGALFMTLDAAGDTALAWLLAALVIIIFPAMLAILTVTHSILESLNPLAIGRLILRARETYWVAPFTVIVVAFVTQVLAGVHILLYELILIILSLIAAGLTGRALRPFKLFDEVDIHTDESAADDKRRSTDNRQREANLGHAYGFASRNNLSGALDHLAEAIASDRDEFAAWRYYFDHMLNWDDAFPALKFGQRYVHYLLSIDAGIDAMKLVMRCRLIDERFRPLPDDLPMVVELLEKTGQDELARALRG